LEDARVLLSNGETGMARTLAIQALAVHPTVALQALLAQVLTLRGEAEEAEPLWRLLARNPEHAVNAELQLGNLCEARGELQLARRHFERALAADPDAPAPAEHARRLKALLDVHASSAAGLHRLTRAWGQAAAGERFIVLEESGRGGAATLFKAEETPMQRVVALKLFHPKGNAVLRAERVRLEAALAVKASGPGVVPILDAQPNADLLVMPFYAEGSLKGLLARGALAPPRALLLAAELAEHLARVHDAGVVHLDVKPSNILLQNGHPVLTDFGAAAAFDLGQGAGTPPYLAPEAIHGSPGPSADLYALGVVLVECLTGHATANPDGLAGPQPWRRGCVHLIRRLVEENPRNRLANASRTAQLCHALASAAPTL
jgi:hypothetical protein